MYRFLFFYANMIVNKNEVLNKVKLKVDSLSNVSTKATKSSVGNLCSHNQNCLELIV